MRSPKTVLITADTHEKWEILLKNFIKEIMDKEIGKN